MAAARMGSLGLRFLSRLAAASESRDIQFILFAILAAMVGILFTVRATYVSSFRSYDMDAVGYLLSSAKIDQVDSTERLLACINLLASEDSRDAESIFTLVTVMFAVGAVILGVQTLFVLMRLDLKVFSGWTGFIFPWIVPHFTSVLAGIISIFAVLVISGFLVGVRIIPLPPPGEGVQLFGYRELPRWSHVQIPLENAPGLLDVLEALEKPEVASPEGGYKTCLRWAERPSVSAATGPQNTSDAARPQGPQVDKTLPTRFKVPLLTMPALFNEGLKAPREAN